MLEMRRTRLQPPLLDGDVAQRRGAEKEKEESERVRWQRESTIWEGLKLVDRIVIWVFIMVTVTM